MQQIIDEEVMKTMNDGVFELSMSPLKLPIVIMRKMTGKYSFFIDDRKLNQVSTKDAHPLPRKTPS